VPRRISDRKHEAILKAATETFRRDGFQATTMDAIAEHAKVSKRTIYKHFLSKDQLFDAVIAIMWERLVPSDEHLPPATQPVAARLRAFARARVDALLDDEAVGLFSVVLGESANAPELARAYPPRRDRRASLGLAELLQDEVARGRLHVDRLELAASQLWGLILSPLFWPLVMRLRGVPDPAERQVVVDDGVAIFVQHYGSARATPR